MQLDVAFGLLSASGERSFVRLVAAVVLAATPGCPLELGGGIDPGPRTRPPSLPDEPQEGSGASWVPGTIPNGLCQERPIESLDFELPVWDLYVSDKRWDLLHEDVDAKVQVDAAICIEGTEYLVGLELQGASSRDAPKKSFDLKFEHGRPLRNVPFRDASAGTDVEGDGYERILLKAMYADPSLIREAIAFDLWREMGHEAPRVGFVNLRINRAFWGLYVLVEPVDEAYLDRHGYPPDGRLYKAVRKHGEWADFEPGRDLALAFENKTDEDDESRDDLEALLHTLQDTPLERAAFEREIDPIFPLPNYMERMIWVSFTQNGDAVAQNFFLYNAAQEGRAFWYQLPWDSNLCFSAHWNDPDDVLPPERSLLIDGRNHFGKRLIRVDGLREAYVERFYDVMNHVLTPEVVLGHHQRHAAYIERDLALDQERWERDTAPAAAFDVLTEFFERRPDLLSDGLGDLIADSEANESQPDDEVDGDDGVDEAEAP